MSSLDVGVNWIQSKTLAGLLKGSAPLQLERLVIGPNMAAVGDEGATLIAGCGRLERLQHLDMTNNLVGDAGVRALAASESFALQHLALPNDEEVFHMDCHSWARNTVAGTMAHLPWPNRRACRASECSS